MHYAKYLTVIAVLATSVIAAPAAEPEANKGNGNGGDKGGKGGKKGNGGNKQTNGCGQNNRGFCCDTDSFGKYVTCKLTDSDCSNTQTQVCCNANNSIQVCLGNVPIIL
ncbi:uncharacterized protein LTR77_007734 [Saxophila tyrrhenica]|uniref:Hydrophobin n=1 Tax=Saxophila tyrrhenica TaxID=1690608 RepID=A0AAV9P5Q6_9PEZI|nr:hypothetical protein LTR77_007734 [Saxophila tyrrhenica]